MALHGLLAPSPTRSRDCSDLWRLQLRWHSSPIAHFSFHVVGSLIDLTSLPLGKNFSCLVRPSRTVQMDLGYSWLFLARIRLVSRVFRGRQCTANQTTPRRRPLFRKAVPLSSAAHTRFPWAGHETKLAHLRGSDASDAGLILGTQKCPLTMLIKTTSWDPATRGRTHEEIFERILALLKEAQSVCVCVCVVSCAPVHASLEAIVKHIETIWAYTVLCFSGILWNPLQLLCFLSGWSGNVWSSLWFFPPLVFVPWMGSWKWYATVWSMSVSFQQIFAWRPFVMAVIASFQGPWATIFCIQGGE